MRENIEYSEVLEILGYMNPQYVEKLPKEMLELLENNKLNDYEPHIDSSVPLSEQYINPKTAAVLALMYLQYWCENEIEEEELKEVYINNETNYLNRLKEKYEIENMFNDKEVDTTEVTENVDVGIDLVEYERPSIFKRIIHRIKGFLKKHYTIDV